MIYRTSFKSIIFFSLYFFLVVKSNAQSIEKIIDQVLDSSSKRVAGTFNVTEKSYQSKASDAIIKKSVFHYKKSSSNEMIFSYKQSNLSIKNIGDTLFRQFDDDSIVNYLSGKKRINDYCINGNSLNFLINGVFEFNYFYSNLKNDGFALKKILSSNNTIEIYCAKSIDTIKSTTCQLFINANTMLINKMVYATYNGFFNNFYSIEIDSFSDLNKSELFQLMELPNSSYRRQDLYNNENTISSTINVGSSAPLWEGYLNDTLKIYSWNTTSKLVLLDFWFQNCLPCKKTKPIIEKIRTEFSKNDLAIYAVNPIDNPKAISNINENGIITIFDKTKSIKNSFHIANFPTLFLIDNVKGLIILNPKNDSELYEILRSKISDYLTKMK